MALWVCEHCSEQFKRDKSGERPIRFCSQHCYHAWSKAHQSYKGCFPKGNIPWTKGKKGIHLSPATEFTKGQPPPIKLPVGSVQIRTRHKRGRDTRAWVKIAEPNKWKLRAIVTWEAAYGPLPKGLLIHHMDHNSLNDNITNLCAFTRAAHAKEHHQDLVNARNKLYQKRKQILKAS